MKKSIDNFDIPMYNSRTVKGKEVNRMLVKERIVLKGVVGEKNDAKNFAEINIEFCGISRDKRGQIEDAMKEFLDLAEKIVTDD